MRMGRVGSGVKECVGKGGGEQEIIPKRENRGIHFIISVKTYTTG